MRLLLSVVCAAFISLNGLAGKVVVVEENTHKVTLGAYFDYVEDPAHSYSFDEVRAMPNDAFSKIEGEHANFGMTTSRFWFRFRIRNTTHKRMYLQTINYQDTLYMYCGQGDGTYKLLKSGKWVFDQDIAYQTNRMLLHVDVPVDEEVEVYLMVTCTDPMEMPAWLLDNKSIIEDGHRQDQGMLFYYGFMMFIFIFNLVLLISERSLVYLWYVLYIGIFSTVMLMGKGYIMEYVDPGSLVHEHPFPVISVSIMAALQFTRSFLRTRENSPFWDKVSVGYLIAFGIGILMNFIPGLYIWSNMFLIFLLFSSSIVATIIGIAVYRRGFKPARFYIAGWGVLMLGVVTNGLALPGWVSSSNLIVLWSIEWGTAGEAFFLSLAIVDRIRTLQKETIRVQEEAKVTLEAKVEERTFQLAEKNREITDSITYAQRIQEAILPEMEEIRSALPDSFVLFKPKDIVSGDYYWFSQQQGKTIIAAVDCTGHGVPGAFMSMIGNDLLNQIVNERKETEPGKILDQLREGVISALRQKGKDGETKDGMDMALCAIDLKTGTVDYAGANNPLYLMRAGEVIEIKADKQPIGVHDDQQPFTTHSFPVQPQDRLYLFTDGYADQFGGPKGKKFKYKPFKELLLSLSDQSMQDQLRVIDARFKEWKGEQEQVDDVCVIGVKV